MFDLFNGQIWDTWFPISSMVSFFPIAKLSKYSMVEHSSFKFIQLLKILVQWLDFTSVNSSLGYLFPHLIFLFNGFNFHGRFFFSRCFSTVNFLVQWVQFPWVNSSFWNAFPWSVFWFNGFNFHRWILSFEMHFHG